MYAHTCLTQILLLNSFKAMLSSLIGDTGFQSQTPRWYPLFLAYFLLLLVMKMYLIHAFYLQDFLRQWIC